MRRATREGLRGGARLPRPWLAGLSAMLVQGLSWCTIPFAGRSPRPEPGAARGARVVVRGIGQPALYSDPDWRHRPYGYPHATRITPEMREPLAWIDSHLSDPERQLESNLSHPDVMVRRAAMEGLLKLCNTAWMDSGGYECKIDYKTGPVQQIEKPSVLGKRTLEAVMRCFHDKDWIVRKDAGMVFTFAHHQDKWVVDPYIARLAQRIKQPDETPEDVERKIDLIEAAGAMGRAFSDYCDTLKRQYEHEDWRVRYATVIAMQQQDERRYLLRKYLSTLTRDENDQVREVAAKYYYQDGHDATWLDFEPKWRSRAREKKQKYRGRGGGGRR